MLDGHSTNTSEMQHNGMEGIKSNGNVLNFCAERIRNSAGNIGYIEQAFFTFAEFSTGKYPVSDSIRLKYLSQI